MWYCASTFYFTLLKTNATKLDDLILCRVQARILGPLRLDPDRPEYHRATIQWEVDDFSGRPG